MLMKMMTKYLKEIVIGILIIIIGVLWFRTPAIPVPASCDAQNGIYEKQIQDMEKAVKQLQDAWNNS